MNLAEAWEAGNGIAVYQFHSMNIIVKYVDEQHVGFKFGTEQTGYKHVPLSPLWAFGGWLKDLGIKPQEGWEPGKDNNHEKLAALTPGTKVEIIEGILKGERATVEVNPDVASHIQQCEACAEVWIRYDKDGQRVHRAILVPRWQFIDQLRVI